MWPLVVALGVYVVCKGVQQGIDENRYNALPGPRRRPELPRDNYEEIPCDVEGWEEDEYDDF